MNGVKKALRQLHRELKVPAITSRRMMQERLRQKVAEDIVTIMTEQEYTIEEVAKSLRMKKEELRRWIWKRDLKLSELSLLLSHLDSEFYPIIRPRNRWRKTL